MVSAVHISLLARTSLYCILDNAAASLFIGLLFYTIMFDNYMFVSS